MTVAHDHMDGSGIWNGTDWMIHHCSLYHQASALYTYRGLCSQKAGKGAGVEEGWGTET